MAFSSSSSSGTAKWSGIGVCKYKCMFSSVSLFVISALIPIPPDFEGTVVRYRFPGLRSKEARNASLIQMGY